jgi:aminomethyltransferase
MGQIRYSVLLNEAGGMLDDLMIARAPETNASRLYIVVNGATKEDDFRLLQTQAGATAVLARADDHALIAVQGPQAEAVTTALFPGADGLSFMTCRAFEHDGASFLVARSGYTGEDGYEILAPPQAALGFYDRLMSDPRTKPIGLGARDSLRLEAGLSLYGHDADETVSPVEAGLSFAIARKRRDAKNLRGGDRLEAELSGRLDRKRVDRHH